MADFKTALKALGQGRLQPDMLRQQISRVISSKPALAEAMLLQLRQAFEQQDIGRDLYDSLSSHINSLTVVKDRSEDATTVAAPTQQGGQSPQAQAPTMIGEDEASTEISAAMDMAAAQPTAMEQKQASGSGEQAESGAASGVGDVLKHRFKLLSVLGQGGMGKVFKGIDLLKEEAKDKNPYVAIKLLNEDFKRHPEAFIALQRESSRQQKLAHPNIATVYDFDRVGSTGTQVFITMELMEGEPLNAMIRNKIRPNGGMPFEEAFPIIQGLGNALIYAHNRKIVHSDFKPGNSFLCNDGTVKVLDFGIARAVKNPQAGEGEKTLFDPGKLGALTPAYASLEMLEGEDPDTRDDIYALGCVAYELLTGQHPYNKTPANVARDKKMSAPTVKGLKGKQNRALARSVAFARKDRSPDVETFLEGLEGKFQWNNPWFIAGMVALVTVLVGTFPTLDYLHNKKIQGMVNQINIDQDFIGPFLNEQFPALTDEDKKIILDNARDAIQGHFQQRIRRVANPDAGLYDYPQANKIIDEAAQKYPDSLWLNEIKSEVTDDKNQVLYDLNKKYISYLEARNLIQSDDSEEITDILRLIATVEPGHPLLEDRRLGTAYREAAEREMEAGQLDLALAYIESGLTSAPRDAALINLRDKITTEIRVAELNQSLAPQIGQMEQLPQIKQIEGEVLELASLRPNHELLQQLAEKAKPLVGAELQRILAEGGRADAEAAIADYGDLLSTLKLNSERNELQLAHLSGQEREDQIQKILQDSRDRLGQLLASPEVGSAPWELQVQVNMQQIQTLVGAEDASLALLQEQAVGLYSPSILSAAESQRFTEAYALLDRTSELTAKAPQVESVRGQVKALEDAYIKQREEEERQARVQGYKTELLLQAQAFDVDAAALTLQKLKAELPASDPFLETEVPAVLETAYLRVSADAAAAANYQRALDKAKEGFAALPNSGALQKAIGQYQLALDVDAAKKMLGNLATVELGPATQALAKVRQASPEEHSALATEFVQKYAAQIDQANQANNRDLAATLARVGTALFPDSSELRKRYDQLQVPEWDSTPAAAAINSGKLSEAGQLIAAAPQGDPGAIEMKQRLDERTAQAEQLRAGYRQQIQSAPSDVNNLRQALNLVNQAQGLWVDSPDIAKDKDELQKRINQLSGTGAGGLLKQETDISELEEAADAAPAEEAAPQGQPEPAGGAGAQEGASDSPAGDAGADAGTGGTGAGTETAKVEPPPAAPWVPVPSGQECSARLAGYGKRAKALCFDVIGNKGLRGPLMVVVPAGEGFASPFAISKYEISVNDYNKYCFVSKKCTISKADKDLPMTGLAAAEVEAYLAWLSERTGKVYRLPNPGEWGYAANAGGKQPKKDFNCRVVIGEKVLKGTGLISVKSGQQNGWGLKNYLGNAQELVRDGGGLKVYGGAYEDSLSACDISLARDHGGGADDITGFRVLLEKVL